MRSPIQDYPSFWRATDLMEAIQKIDPQFETIENFYRRGAITALALEDIFRVTPEDEVLDYGGGLGRVAIPLASKVKRITIVEASVDMLKLAQPRLVELNNIRTSFMPCGGPQIILANNLFHWGFAREVFRHMHAYDVQLALREIERMLKPDGAFCFDFEDGASAELDTILTGVDAPNPNLPPMHYHTMDLMYAMVRRAGMNVVQKHVVNGHPQVTFVVQKCGANVTPLQKWREAEASKTPVSDTPSIARQVATEPGVTADEVLCAVNSLLALPEADRRPVLDKLARTPNLFRAVQRSLEEIKHQADVAVVESVRMDEICEVCGAHTFSMKQGHWLCVKCQREATAPAEETKAEAVITNVGITQAPFVLTGLPTTAADAVDKLRRFYLSAERTKKPKLVTPYACCIEPTVTLINHPQGIGDVMALTHIPGHAHVSNKDISVYSASRFFRPLMEFVPHYKDNTRAFCVSAAELNGQFDLGNGHFFQRLQRAYDLTPDMVPMGTLVVPGAVPKTGRIILHLDPGVHADWQRKNIHPRAREIYQENMAILQEFVTANQGRYEFIDVGRNRAPLKGVTNQFNDDIREVVRLMATAEFFIGIISGPMHMAAALGLKSIVIINFPPAEKVFLPTLVNIDQVESEWFYPMSVHLHQEGEGPLVPRFTLQNIYRAINGEIYPYWSEAFLPLINEKL